MAGASRPLMHMEDKLFPVEFVDPTAGMDYSGLGSYSPGSMSYGATSWDGVLANGVSRFFDVAGRIAIAKNLPYYQTAAGQQTAQWQAASAATSRMMTLLLMGAVALIVIKKMK